jgi:hydroxymethylglutaryl-CoA reductase (NADPH)
MEDASMKNTQAVAPVAKLFEAAHVAVPFQKVGPAALLFGDAVEPELVEFPLATFETPLWPSVGRGAKVCREIGGLRLTLLGEGMTRSVAVKARSAHDANALVRRWKDDPLLRKKAEATGRFVALDDWTARIVGRNIYLRFCFTTAEAAGHNMVTKASDAVLAYLCTQYPVEYISVSGNMCVDKKTSAVNSILGRGKSVVAEGVIPESKCRPLLKTTPEAIHKLNIDKNYIGSLAAGSLCSANAHYANMLLAFYLATGQDAANIVEGSQGITTTEIVTTPEGQTGLYFAVNLPNIIVGAIGSGKDHDGVRQNMRLIGCAPDQPEPDGFTKSQRLAMTVAASVWCGELSLMAAQTNPGELMATHVRIERDGKEG